MSNLPHWLLMRAEQGAPITVSVDQIQQWPAAEFQWCLNSEVLIPAQPAEELACRHCAEQPIEPIVWLGGGADRQSTAYLPCPNCGPVIVPAEQLRQWRLDATRLWSEIFRAAGVALQVREIVPGHLWKIGKVDWPTGNWDVLVGCRLNRPREQLHGIRFPPQSVLFVPSKQRSADFGKGATPPVICLLDVIGWEDNRLFFDRDHVVGLLSGASPPGARQVPRPTRKRAERATNIEALTKLLKEHVAAARDHALVTADAGHTKLLPRPSQRDLARLAGMTEMAASRCFRDPVARELRMLWELAGDLDRLLVLPASRTSSRTGR